MDDEDLFKHAELAGRMVLNRYPFLDSVQVCVKKLKNGNIARILVHQDRNNLIQANDYGEV